MCSYVFGPGGYYYCGLADAYGSFYSSRAAGSVCNFVGRPFHDPVTNVVYNMFGANGTQFLVQYLWSLQSGGCQLQFEESCKSNFREEQTKTGSSGIITVGYFARNGGGSLVGMQRYAAGLNCSWAVNVTDAKSLSFTFSGFNTAATLDFLQLQSTLDERHRIGIAGSLFTPKLEVFLGSSAIIKFTSDGTRSPAPGSTGWQLTYTPGYCEGVVELVGKSGNLTDGTPSGKNYASGLNCSWVVKPQQFRNNSLTLIFTRLYIGPTDHLTIYEGEYIVSARKLQYISSTKFDATTSVDPLYTITTTNGSFLVNFVTSSNEGQGWAAKYGPTHILLPMSQSLVPPTGSLAVNKSSTTRFSNLSPLNYVASILVHIFFIKWTQ